LVADTREEGERVLGYAGLMSSQGRNGGRGGGGKRRKKSVEEDREEDGKIKCGDGSGASEGDGLGAFEASYEGMKERDVEESDDLTVIHPSRTFLASVSSKSVIVRVSEFM
jgi:hypothetical protein